VNRVEQIGLVREFCSQVAEAMIREADTWPDHWDGHELRELVAERFELERTSLMRRDRARKRRFNKENASRFYK